MKTKRAKTATRAKITKIDVIAKIANNAGSAIVPRMPGVLRLPKSPRML